MRRIHKVFISLLIITTMIIANTYNVAASESKQQVRDLTNLTNDEIVKELDQSPETQDFIVLNSNQLKEIKGYPIQVIFAEEDFAKVNSSMGGVYGILRVNDHFVFCIEPGSDALNSAEQTAESGSVYSKFASKSKTYLSKVISSSIQNYEQTKNDAYIFAGQLLIWDYVSTYEADVIDNDMSSWNPDFLNSWTINNSMYYPQIKIINAEIEDWNVLPSFLDDNKAKAKGFTLKYDEKSDEFSTILIDTNKVWDKKYANYKQVGNYKLTNPSGSDNVKISTSKVQTAYSSPFGFTWIPTISDKKEFYDAGQDLIYVGALPVDGFMKFKTEAYPNGGFKLQKGGEQINGQTVPLSDVKFKVTGPDFNKTYVTDKNGNISVTNELVPGDYHIEETSAPSQYVSNFSQDFTVKPGKITSINGGNQIENKLYYNKIKFTKVGEILNGGENDTLPLAGVQFELYEEEGEPNNIIDESDILISKLVSNQDGVVESDKLYAGNYIIQEVVTLEGYQLYDQPYSFQIANTGKFNSGTVVDLGTVTNSAIKGRVKLSKIGVGSCPRVKECSEPLDKVKFDIYQDANFNGVLDQTEERAVSQIITNQDGTGISDYLNYGSYFLREVASEHPNYEIENRIYPFEIIKDNAVVEVNEGEPIQNSEKTGSIEINKIGESLSNINHDMVNLEGASYQIKDNDGKVINEITTDEQGIAKLDQLSFGTYQVKEVTAPKGYELDPTNYQFKIDENTYKQVIKLKFSDDVIKNEFEISKIDKDDDKPLVGAELEILDRNTDEEIINWTSTEKPFATELNYGEYKICENVAPKGYKLNSKCTNFNVKESNKKQVLQVKNAKLKISSTGYSVKSNWLLGSLIIGELGLCILRGMTIIKH